MLLELLSWGLKAQGATLAHLVYIWNIFKQALKGKIQSDAVLDSFHYLDKKVWETKVAHQEFVSNPSFFRFLFVQTVIIYRDSLWRQGGEVRGEYKSPIHHCHSWRKAAFLCPDGGNKHLPMLDDWVDLHKAWDSKGMKTYSGKRSLCSSGQFSSTKGLKDRRFMLTSVGWKVKDEPWPLGGQMNQCRRKWPKPIGEALKMVTDRLQYGHRVFENMNIFRDIQTFFVNLIVSFYTFRGIWFHMIPWAKA